MIVENLKITIIMKKSTKMKISHHCTSPKGMHGTKPRQPYRHRPMMMVRLGTNISVVMA